MQRLRSKILPGILLAMALPVLADTTFTYQGQLTDSDGPYDGAVEMDFRLYEDETGGGAIDERTEIVGVSGGLFQVALNFGDQPYESGLWLQVSVAGEDLSPRQRVTAAPLAIRALASDVDTFWTETSSGNIRYNGGRVTVGGGLLARFGVDAADDETAMLVRSGGQTGLRVNENRSVSVGANYASNGIPERGLRVWGEAIFNSDVQMQGDLEVHGGGAFDGWMSVGSLSSPQRLGVGTDNPWNTLHVVSGDGDSPLRVMVENNNATSAVLRGYVNQGVAIGHSYADSDVPGNGLIVRGEVHLRELPFRASDPASNVCPEAIDGGPVWRLVRCAPNSSSARFKEDIQPLHGTADLVRALRPVRYAWKDSGREDIGLVAEEVAEVIPDIVIRNADGEIEGFQYNRLGAVLVGAVQEQERLHAERFSALEAENAKLHAQVAELQGKLDRERRETAERLTALEAVLLDGTEVASGRE